MIAACVFVGRYCFLRRRRRLNAQNGVVASISNNTPGQYPQMVNTHYSNQFQSNNAYPNQYQSNNAYPNQYQANQNYGQGEQNGVNPNMQEENNGQYIENQSNVIIQNHNQNQAQNQAQNHNQTLTHAETQ